jgi:transposase-like protein
MPRPYPPEFRARAIALVRAGKQAKQTAVELGIHPVTLSNWIRQDDIDNGRRPGVGDVPWGGGVARQTMWQGC